MKTNSKVIVVLIGAVVIVGLLLSRKSAETPAPPPVPTQVAVEQPSAVEPVAVPPVAEVNVTENTVPDNVVLETSELPAAPEVTEVEEPAPIEPAPTDSAPGRIVFRGEQFAVKPDTVLAEVNNVKITLKDVMPINKASTSEHVVNAAEFQEQLNRAIDREVVFQTVRRRNIQLDEPQRRQVEKARLSAAAKGFSLPDNERQAHEDQSNFASLDLMGTLLSDALAKSAGGPAKDETPEEEYQKYLRGMLDNLKAGSHITENVVIEAE